MKMQSKQEYKIQVAKEGVPITMLTLSLPRLPDPLFLLSLISGKPSDADSRWGWCFSWPGWFGEDETIKLSCKNFWNSKNSLHCMLQRCSFALFNTICSEFFQKKLQFLNIFVLHRLEIFELPCSTQVVFHSIALHTVALQFNALYALFQIVEHMHCINCAGFYCCIVLTVLVCIVQFWWIGKFPYTFVTFYRIV